MAATDPGHLGGREHKVRYKRVKLDSPYDTNPNGNTVSLEEQTVKNVQKMTWSITLLLI